MISIFWFVRLLAKVTLPSITVVPPVPSIAEVSVPSPSAIEPRLLIVSAIFNPSALIAKLEPLLILSAF